MLASPVSEQAILPSCGWRVSFTASSGAYGDSVGASATGCVPRKSLRPQRLLGGAELLPSLHACVYAFLHAVVGVSSWMEQTSLSSLGSMLVVRREPDVV